MKNSNYIFVFILLIISACSSSKETTKEENDNLFSEETVVSPINKLEINLPLGWKLISDNYEQLFDIWLVNNEKNSSIVFIPLSLSKNFNANTTEEALNNLFEFSKTQKKITGSNFLLLNEVEFFELGKGKCRSFQYNNDDRVFNSIIFAIDNIYYECLAYFDSNYEPSSSEFSKLIELQNSIISTAVIK